MVAALSGCSAMAEPAAAVSEHEARAAVADVIATASQRTPAAMKQLCEANDGCMGMSSSLESDPGSAPGPEAAPEVLCVVGIPPTPSQDGSQLVVLEGVDGRGRHYVSQVLVDRAATGDEAGRLEVQEPAFWLGVAYTALQGGRSWDSLTDVPEQQIEHNARARRPCDDTAAWLAEVSGHPAATASRASSA
ncbi:hypothetical protein SAMN06264364_107139 [Quadrisphaera granulorum]|uniref:Uncharacterized protein n=1 Tax=Quadrisphaera granulorum TaxID=317664 RepID=A0A316A9W6_9ACTN|nr:hypothetical protein BXY45_107139 [Quadrisphaera granulorum]SZE96215.1 hypothetical protein SAMN06264364_107139 [Quadrisphaera granulorum]